MELVLRGNVVTKLAVIQSHMRGCDLGWLSFSIALAAAQLISPLRAVADPALRRPEYKWPHGPPADPGHFPLAVWLQDPANADRYRAAGFNLYVGLWQGPTETQLTDLKKANMPVICEQNEVGLRHLDDPIIVGWTDGDEPDNAQSPGARLGWASPIAPDKVLAAYEKMRLADPSRPVFLSLGQGVAWDDWYGRGSRTHHPEDYPQYLKGCDIASFDIYPVVHSRPEVAGKLWYVAQGVERLSSWANGQKIVWNCVECARIDNPNRKPTPQQVRCEVWMSLIHGSRGLIYFVHQFKPAFREAALFDDPDMLAAVTALNRQITELAPVLNSPSVTDIAAVAPENPAVPVAVMSKRHAGVIYIFSVAMRDGATTAAFTLRNLPGTTTVEVLGERRTLMAQNGTFKDHFASWDAHIYRVLEQKP